MAKKSNHRSVAPGWRLPGGREWRVIHFAIYSDGDLTPCGVAGSYWASVNPERVTCTACRRYKVFRNCLNGVLASREIRRQMFEQMNEGRDDDGGKLGED